MPTSKPTHPAPAAQNRAPHRRVETPEERAQRVDALRRAYLDGTLDLRVSPESDGVDRLLEDLFDDRPERRRRSRR